MSTKAPAAISAKARREIKRHLSRAATYIEDGAPNSATAHIVAAHRVLEGLPVPKGGAFWTLVEKADELHGRVRDDV